LLASNSQTRYIVPVANSNSKPKVPIKIALIPSAEEVRIMQAAMGKHGINKATDILRMALRRLAENEATRT
jgi:hypothetical protein